MSRKSNEEPDPTEAIDVEGLGFDDVDPNVMSAPDQAEIGRLQALRDTARDDDAVRGYDTQIQAITARYSK